MGPGVGGHATWPAATPVHQVEQWRHGCVTTVRTPGWLTSQERPLHSARRHSRHQAHDREPDRSQPCAGRCAPAGRSD